MATYEQDPDIVRWGLHLLDGGLDTVYPENTNLENDETIGRDIEIESSQREVTGIMKVVVPLFICLICFFSSCIYISIHIMISICYNFAFYCRT